MNCKSCDLIWQLPILVLCPFTVRLSWAYQLSPARSFSHQAMFPSMFDHSTFSLDEFVDYYNVPTNCPDLFAALQWMYKSCGETWFDKVHWGSFHETSHKYHWYSASKRVKFSWPHLNVPSLMALNVVSLTFPQTTRSIFISFQHSLPIPWKPINLISI